MNSTSCKRGKISYFYKTVVNGVEGGGTSCGGMPRRLTPEGVLERAQGSWVGHLQFLADVLHLNKEKGDKQLVAK